MDGSALDNIDLPVARYRRYCHPIVERRGIVRIDNVRPSNHAMLETTVGAMMISFSAVWVKLAHVTPTVSA